MHITVGSKSYAVEVFAKGNAVPELALTSRRHGRTYRFYLSKCQSFNGFHSSSVIQLLQTAIKPTHLDALLAMPTTPDINVLELFP
jgi:hypothetical protein